jgi:hypothetical protein
LGITIVVNVKPLNRAVTLALFVSLLVLPILFGQTSTDTVASLKQQIEQLKQENQELRQALAGTRATPSPAVAQVASKDEELTHWLTSSSGKRHNNTCRWYHNSRGRPCRADEGTPCKICGG